MYHLQKQAKDKNCKVTKVGFDVNTGKYNLAEFEKALPIKPR